VVAGTTSRAIGVYSADLALRGPSGSAHVAERSTILCVVIANMHVVMDFSGFAAGPGPIANAVEDAVMGTGRQNDVATRMMRFVSRDVGKVTTTPGGAGAALDAVGDMSRSKNVPQVMIRIVGSVGVLFRQGGVREAGIMTGGTRTGVNAAKSVASPRCANHVPKRKTRFVGVEKAFSEVSLDVNAAQNAANPSLADLEGVTETKIRVAVGCGGNRCVPPCQTFILNMLCRAKFLAGY